MVQERQRKVLFLWATESHWQADIWPKEILQVRTITHVRDAIDINKDMGDKEEIQETYREQNQITFSDWVEAENRDESTHSVWPGNSDNKYF